MKNNPELYAESWNFGPNYSNNIDVQRLADRIILEWGHGRYELPVEGEKNACHEATTLMLDIAKSVTKLGWKPVYNIEKTVRETVAWYKNYYEKKEDLDVFSMKQIDAFLKEAENSFLK